MTLTVDVISDVICPWCFIGKRRLEKAIAAHGEPVLVQWHAFQLNPTMPREGMSRTEYRIKKFESWERSMQRDANIVATGKDEGTGNEARRIGVGSVPFFVVNGKIALSGAQHPDTFLETFMQAGGSVEWSCRRFEKQVLRVWPLLFGPGCPEASCRVPKRA